MKVGERAYLDAQATLPRSIETAGLHYSPFCLGERIVARVDLKADRQACEPVVAAADLEAHASAEEVLPALAEELRAVSEWLDLERVPVRGRGGLSRHLAAAVG